MSQAIQELRAALFQALSHPTRIAILEQLRNGELSAGALLRSLDVAQANISQHLAVLRAKQLVVNRKEGNQVFYSLRNPHLLEVLDAMRNYFQAHLADSLLMLSLAEEKQ